MQIYSKYMQVVFESNLVYYNLINFIKHQVLLMVLKMSRIGALGIVAN